MKIIVTLGPATNEAAILKNFARLGVDYFRINLSHLNFDEFKTLFQKVKDSTNIPIIIDTQGPQIRFTKFGREKVHIRQRVFSCRHYACSTDSMGTRSRSFEKT